MRRVILECEAGTFVPTVGRQLQLALLQVANPGALQQIRSLVLYGPTSPPGCFKFSESLIAHPQSMTMRGGLG
ncbi:MAG: hypothetical protein JKY65_04655 [Planctomycetes bacterium]|nr:hypothetical protein [Planctomycetota bacterium]